MADWQASYWTASPNAPARDDRAGGEYSTYRPDLLMDRPLALASDVSDLSWQVENTVRRLGDRPGARGLEGLARFLLRSEAIASSRISFTPSSKRCIHSGTGTAESDEHSYIQFWFGEVLLLMPSYLSVRFC